ncbi:MAG: hypothetical protein ACUVUG_05865 [Candidatus Aminicenantia bacterium]
MKKIVLILTIFLMGQIISISDYRINAVAKPYYLKRGETGKVLISIELLKDSYIKPAPPLIIKCFSSEGVSFPKEIFKSSELNLPIIQKNNISSLSIKEGIEIPFTIDTTAKKGKRELTFEIKFMICSESTGICSKAIEKITVKIYITRRILKK